MYGYTRFCRVWLGFRGFGWVWVCGFGLVGLAGGGGIVGFGGGLHVYGAKKGLCVDVWGGFLVLYVFGGKFASENCLICENLSTFQNSQNFVNFHLSKIKGGTLSNPALGFIQPARLCNFNFIFIIRSNSLYPFPFGNKPAKHIISPFFRLV